MNDTRVALVNSRSILGAIDDNLMSVRKWARSAAAAGARIVCFPEMNLTGYTFKEAIRAHAQSIPGALTHSVQAIAVETGITILAGMAEKTSDGRLFITHLVVRPDEKIELYRKIHLSPLETGVFSHGKSVPTFSIEGTCIGLELCYDAHFPELTTRLALAGADAVFIPHASPRGTPEEKLRSWMRHLPARAFDNSLFTLACNQVGENGTGLCFPGVAVAIDPSGNVMDQDISGTESLRVIDLKSHQLEEVRSHPMRYFLPNRQLKPPEMVH